MNLSIKLKTLLQITKLGVSAFVLLFAMSVQAETLSSPGENYAPASFEVEADYSEKDNSPIVLAQSSVVTIGTGFSTFRDCFRVGRVFFRKKFPKTYKYEAKAHCIQSGLLPGAN